MKNQQNQQRTNIFAIRWMILIVIILLIVAGYFLISLLHQTYNAGWQGGYDECLNKLYYGFGQKNWSDLLKK
jgi:ABC-type transport system involved in multi-copper enzyme maturation permease subunit